LAKRFVRIESGKKIAGVCTGLSAYLHIDVTWIRVAFVLLALAFGTAIVAYVVVWAVAPVAETQPQD